MLQYEIDTPLYKLTELIGDEKAIASYQACSDAIDKLQRLAKEIGSHAGFKSKSSLYYASRKKDLAGLKREFLARQSAGFEVSWLTAEQVKSQYNVNHSYGAILSRQGASIDAFCFAHELLDYNVKRGLEIYDKTALVSVTSRTRDNLVKLSTGACIKVKKIIYCTGYETAEYIPDKFVQLLSTFALVSEVDADLYAKYKDLLLWNTSDPYLYMRTTDDGRFLIGGEDEEFYNALKRDRLIGKKSAKLARSYKKIFGRDILVDFSWAGTFGVTKDGLPYIGEHNQFKNSYFVCGFGGNGITFSVAAMDMVSNWLKNKKHPLTELFKFGR